MSTPFILDVLADINPEYAYRLLENKEMPGWLYMAENSTTTIWEGWEGPNSKAGIASLNHYSKGAVCEWIFDEMCGVKIAGENQFMIAPNPGGHFTHAKFEYDSIYGTVISSWNTFSRVAPYAIIAAIWSALSLTLADFGKVKSVKMSFGRWLESIGMNRYLLLTAYLFPFISPTI